MGKIKQGILGGFRGKVGTVVGSYWNGIFYMKSLPQSYKKDRSGAKAMRQGYFKELVTLSMSLTNEELEFIYPRKPKGMTRRNLLVKQLASYAAVVGKSKTVDLDSLTSLGNAPVTDLPAVSVAANRTVLQISWDGVTYYREQHPDDFPVILVANITQQRLFLVASSVAMKSSGKQSFEVELKPYGLERDEFSGFMFATGQGGAKVGFGTLGVTKRPPFPPKKTKDEKAEKMPESGPDQVRDKSVPTSQAESKKTNP
ncbi:MAG: hypothetical protein IKH44_07975 [Bacteroidales bacterium]|nr:hypothetical protein [Bacteroidales bacterium]